MGAPESRLCIRLPSHGIQWTSGTSSTTTDDDTTDISKDSTQIIEPLMKTDGMDEATTMFIGESMNIRVYRPDRIHTVFKRLEQSDSR